MGIKTLRALILLSADKFLQKRKNITMKFESTFKNLIVIAYFNFKHHIWNSGKL